MSSHDTAGWLIEIAWIVFCAYWFIMAFRVKRAVKRQSWSGRFLHNILVMFACLLMFPQHLNFGPLDARFVPEVPVWAAVAVVLTYAGVALAIWARTILGGNWSGTVTVKRDHTLVRQGPYSTVRHPIYSGLLLAGLGTALAIGELRGLAAVAIGLAGFYAKSKLEERFMIEQFGSEYEKYRRHTWALVPFLL